MRMIILVSPNTRLGLSSESPSVTITFWQVTEPLKAVIVTGISFLQNRKDQANTLMATGSQESSNQFLPVLYISTKLALKSTC